MALTPLQRLRLWLTRTKSKIGGSQLTKAGTEFQQTALQTLQPTHQASTVMLSGVRLVFGLEWNPLSPGVEVEQSLQEARNAGFNYAALMADGSLVGLARDLGPGRGKAYSAVLVVVDQLASTEVEVYIFQFGQQVCFIGLVDRKPVSGFDLLLPSLDEAMAILTEFRAMHVGHEIRVLTNLQSTELPNAEQVRLDTLVSLLGPQLLVKRLINRPLRRAVGIAIFVTVVLASTVSWYLYEQAEERKRQEEAARIAHESDPNYIYEQAIQGLLKNAGTPGNLLLRQWRELLEALPIQHKGWMLARVECQAIGCKATWVRFHGSFRDFDSPKPSNAIDVPELDVATTDNLLNMTLETHHQLPSMISSGSAIDQASAVNEESAAANSGKGLDREKLPLLRAVTLQWGSLLQDWSLLKVSVKLEKPVLFGPPGMTDIAPIKKPVAMMPWEIEDDIWSLPAVNLPGDAIPQSLLVTIDGLKAHYKLTGALYAKAKKF